jgi:hypothetical protein
VDDGRRYLNSHPDEKFDLISIDPLREHTAGHNNLYSQEAMRLYQKHLTPNGVLCAWMHEPHIVPNTIAAVFPYADQFGDEFTVAGNNPIIYHSDYMDSSAADYATLTANLYGPNSQVKLNPSSALGSFQRDQDQIRTDEKESKILTDLHPWLEYYLLTTPVKVEIHTDPNQVALFQSRIDR